MIRFRDWKSDISKIRIGSYKMGISKNKKGGVKRGPLWKDPLNT